MSIPVIQVGPDGQKKVVSPVLLVALDGDGNLAAVNISDLGGGGGGSGGDASAANQELEITILDTISDKLPASPGKKAAAGSLSVTLATSETVPVTGPLTDAQLRATALPVSGPLTNAQFAAPIGTAADASTIDWENSATLIALTKGLHERSERLSKITLGQGVNRTIDSTDGPVTGIGFAILEAFEDTTIVSITDTHDVSAATKLAGKTIPKGTRYLGYVTAIEISSGLIKCYQGD